MITPDYHSFFSCILYTWHNIQYYIYYYYQILHKTFCNILSFFVFLHKGQSCPKVQNLNKITCDGIYLCTGIYFFKSAYFVLISLSFICLGEAGSDVQYTDRQHLSCRQETDEAGLVRQHRRADAPDPGNGYK